MLIIDMPMPVNCMLCPFSSGCSFCEGYDDYCVLAPKDAKYEWNFSDGKEPKERPSWCPIKGEIVRCGECKYWWKENELCRHTNHCEGYVCVHECGAGSYCSDGERKDGIK